MKKKNSKSIVFMNVDEKLLNKMLAKQNQFSIKILKKQTTQSKNGQKT